MSARRPGVRVAGGAGPGVGGLIGWVVVAGGAIGGIFAQLGCDYDAKVPPTARDSGDGDGDDGVAAGGDVEVEGDAIGDTDGVCQAIAEGFEEALWKPLISGCIVCHRVGGIAGGSDFVLVPGTSPEGLAENLRRLGRVAQKVVNGESVLLLRPTGRHPEGHPGGAPLEVGSETYQALEQFVRNAAACGWGTGAAEPCAPEGPRLLRRLSREEWAQTVFDLVGVEVDARVLAPDDVVHGFDNEAGALTVSSLLADQLRGESERVALVAVETRWSRLVSCELGSEGCAAHFLREVGLRAFRRPLSDEELGRYQRLYASVVTGAGGASVASVAAAREGLVWVLAAMLQSPHFLYRSELGVRAESGDFELTDWEIATALSYLAWGTMPDEALFRKAAAGAFTKAGEESSAAIATELERMLGEARAEATLERFVVRWLRLDLLATVTRDATLYPPLDEGLRADLVSEVARLFVEAVHGGDSLGDLLESRKTYLNERLLAHYGIVGLPAGARGPADASGFFPVALGDSPYGGLLASGAVMTTHALPLSSSPIHRGKLVRERLLCEDLPPPPSNLNTSPPRVDPTKSTRERYAQHASDEACWGCHERIDPIGFGFERFDAVGRFRVLDGVHPIDERGWIVGLQGADGAGDARFEGPRQLAATLAGSEVAGRCELLQQARFSLGREPTTCQVSRLRDAQVARGGRLVDAILALVDDVGFRVRRGGSDESDTPAVGAWDFDAVVSDPITPGEDPVGPVAGEVAWERVETSRWQTGYCVQVNVRNAGQAPVSWAIVMDVDGVIANLWNATASEVSGRSQRFVGVEWNATLGGSQSTNFGYCANL